ncbi:formaldehyde dehydrogenase AdhA [Phytophthora cinnamomi]|uniref:formaldehyde dehydrogenase AdhA n=1 Tax=Phytophthora cinnamomi TaxID=4785 RepID=UPI0035595E51|nr:formaldehyde dehydrogenase AdhA [Phytophthora cinnamomi]
MAFASPPGFVPILPRGAACDLDTLATFAVPMPQNAPQHRRGKAKGKAKPMTSSERGIKFRQRQHERQITLLTDNQMLRQQVLRLQAMRDMYTQKSLSAPSSIGGTSPMSFVIEYFNQFRIGLQVPGAPAPILSSEKQKDFLGALIEPHTTFGGKPAAELILSIWERYTKFHSSVKLTCESAELITADTSSSVVVHGTLHLRYSRRTIENIYPHAAADEDLIQKLIGRQLHVHYRAQMHFNANGRLEAYEMAPDFVGALMEVLGNLRDCERIMGRALIRGHALGEEPEPEVEGMEPVEILPDSDAEEEEAPSLNSATVEEAEAPPASCRAMNLDYILS